MRLAFKSLVALVLTGIVTVAPVLAQRHAGHEKLGQVHLREHVQPGRPD